MSIKCPSCGRDYDATLFEFSRPITCVCGKVVTFKHEQIKDNVICEREDEGKDQSDEEPV